MYTGAPARAQAGCPVLFVVIDNAGAPARGPALRRDRDIDLLAEGHPRAGRLCKWVAVQLLSTGHPRGRGPARSVAAERDGDGGEACGAGGGGPGLSRGEAPPGGATAVPGRCCLRARPSPGRCWAARTPGSSSVLATGAKVRRGARFEPSRARAGVWCRRARGGGLRTPPARAPYPSGAPLGPRGGAEQALLSLRPALERERRIERVKNPLAGRPLADMSIGTPTEDY